MRRSQGDKGSEKFPLVKSVDATNLLSYKRFFINNLDTYHGKYILKEVSKVLEKNAEVEKMTADMDLLMPEEDEPFPSGIRTPPLLYEIIGTVTDSTIKNIDKISKIVPKKKKELLLQMLSCGTVIIDISCDKNELQMTMDFLKLLKEVLEKEKAACQPVTPSAPDDAGDAGDDIEEAKDKRQLILISTVMTWAMTKPLDPENPDMPFVETDFRKSKPHPKYKTHYNIENEVIALARNYRSQIGALVLNTGVTYGGCEDVLIYWFQKAWECEKLLPILGRGLNLVPMINVADLAKIVFNLVNNFPKKLYILAVEQDIRKQREIIKPIGKLCGNGMFKCIPPDDAFLIPQIDPRAYDLMTVNLSMEPSFIVDPMQLEWTSDGTFADNVLALMKDYTKERRLKSFKIVIYGPPIIGKTTLSKMICENYGLMYLSPETVVNDIIEDLTWRVKHWENGELADLPEPVGEEEEPEIDDEEVDDAAEEAENARITLEMLLAGVQPTEEEKLGYLRQRMLSREGQNKGWVLDGFPTTLQQAALLFEKGDLDDTFEEEAKAEDQFEEDLDLYSNVLRKLLPDVVVTLEATDEFICQKSMRQPESDARLDEEIILHRLAEFRAGDARDVTPLNFFDELDIHPLVVQVQDFADYAMQKPYGEVSLRLGLACSYGKLADKVKAAELRTKQDREHEKLNEAKMAAEMEKKIREEREDKMEYWSELYAVMREEEEAALAVAGEPMRSYLMQHIFPVLTRALLEVASVRPDDPVDFLAEYLFKLNPTGRMLEPGYNLQAELLLGKIKILDQSLAELNINIDPFLCNDADVAEPAKKTINIMRTCSLLATSLRHQTTEFFNNSTLHGVRYIAEKERPFCEKFMWFSFTAVGAVTTCIIIVSLWEKFQTNPTITGLDTDFHNWDVPFPAVTICDMNPVDEELLQEYIQKTWSDSPPSQASDMLRWLATLSYGSIAQRTPEFLNNHDLVGHSNAEAPPPVLDPRDAVFSIVRRCETLFYDCEWKGDSEECCDLLVPVFTELGFCYAFNSKHAEKVWPWQSQTQLEQFVEAFIHETDAKWSFLFNSYRNDTTLDIYIHSTEEMAGLEQSVQHTWERRVEKVSFSVKHTYTTEDARQLSIRQRRCVFADEVKLETNKIYTYTACMRQCRMQRSKQLCKCVPHFYPQMKDYRTCTVLELECVYRNAASITDVTRCACELGCDHTVYEVEKLTQLESRVSATTSLETEFVSWPMVRYKREVLFGWVDLLVSFGGIAGLFLGFSLLSGVELIYFFTLRACCAIVREPDTLVREREERLTQPKPPHDLSLVPWWRKPPETPSAPIIVKPKDAPPQYSPPPGYTTYLP